MGAPVALLTAAKSAQVKAMLAWTGPSDLELWLDTNPYFQNSIPYGCGRSGLSQNLPLYYTPDIRVPVLLLHGALDNSVPPGQSRRMWEALTDAGGKAELIIVEGAGHRFDGIAWGRVWPRVIEHLEKAFAAGAK